MGISLEQYQDMVRTTAIYPNKGNNLSYPTLGLCGEAGEVAEKIKKIMRDDGGVVSPEKKQAIIKELGDVMWYIGALASEIGTTISEVAETNHNKLLSRLERDKLHGSGDDR